MTRVPFTIGIALILAGCADQQDMAGTWTICLRDGEGREVCGDAEVQADRGGTLGYAAYYPLRHNLDLSVVTGSLPAASRICGSLLEEKSGEFQVCGAVVEHDAGNINAEHLEAFEDSVVGRWRQSCFAGCDAAGAFRMVRRRP